MDQPQGGGALRFQVYELAAERESMHFRLFFCCYFNMYIFSYLKDPPYAISHLEIS